jgi:type I restriction enzyme S subunit
VSEIPSSWAETNLGQIRIDEPGTINPAKSPGQSFELYSIPSHELKKPELVQGKEIGSSKQIVQPDTVLISKINPRINRVWVVGNYSDFPKIASTEWIRFPRVDGVQPEYLCHYLQTGKLRKFLAHNVSGVGGSLMRVRPSTIDVFGFPLAPLNEQRRIVAKLEELFSDLDAATAALERVRANLKRYRASVLKSAVEGKLTAEWRAKNPPKETGAHLLERILIERRAKWEENVNRRYKTPEPVEDATSEYPDSWAKVNLGHVTWSIKDGPHYSPKYASSGIPFISGGHVRPHGIDFETAKYITPALHAELSKRCKPELNDVLYTKGGTTGIARVNTYSMPFSVWVHVAVLKLIPSIRPFFLQHVLNSPSCYSQAQKHTHGVGNQDLGLTRMVKITLPVPPLMEQDQITEIIEAKFSSLDKIDEYIVTKLKEVNTLRQAILKQAFEGKLVPQDPRDEPASELLKRIREERALTPSPSPRGRGGKEPGNQKSAKSITKKRAAAKLKKPERPKRR